MVNFETHIIEGLGYASNYLLNFTDLNGIVNCFNWMVFAIH